MRGTKTEFQMNVRREIKKNAKPMQCNLIHIVYKEAKR